MYDATGSVPPFDLLVPVDELARVAAASKADLTVTQGWAQLSVYQFNTKVATHYFCRTCGIYTFHQRRIDPDSVGVNLGCLEDVDLDALTVETADGANE